MGSSLIGRVSAQKAWVDKKHPAVNNKICRDDALAILKIAKEAVELTAEIEALARRLGASGLNPLDALHLAFASTSKVDYFCKCDDKFLKKSQSFDGLNTKVVSPAELVMELDI